MHLRYTAVSARLEEQQGELNMKDWEFGGETHDEGRWGAINNELELKLSVW